MDENESTELLGSTDTGEFVPPHGFFFADFHMVIMRKNRTGCP